MTEGKPTTRLSALASGIERISLALWWGGLSVYAAWVVPIGADVTDETTQGFVTQRVTHGLNLLAAFALLCTARRVWRGGSLTIRIAWSVVGVGLLGQVVLHQWLDQLLDPKTMTLLDADRFYFLHQIYLWLVTVQWLAGVVLVAAPSESRLPTLLPSQRPLE